ncbi:hypothetical protein KKA13_00710 [Patescibacteria group bacterium]|nr:hypothetical protein [Patescibacteria group bacterium]MBU1613505.1 hypothetical protein [Patescibacteria group bacterium]
MFEDQNNPAGTPPTNLPMEPDDMFADLESPEASAGLPEQPNALEAGMLKKAAPPRPSAPTPTPAPRVQPTAPATTEPAPMSYTMREPIVGKIILFVVLAVVLGGLGFGAWWVYNNIYKGGGLQNLLPNGTQQSVPTPPTTTEPEPSTEISPTTTETSTTTNVTTDMTNDSILFGEQLDTDRDGLDDIREKELGTDPENVDTDKDELKDGDEVIIWHTNPLNKDTDGDSFLDGEEVRNGYNPLGPGKLQILPPQTGSTSTNATDTNVNI